MRIRLIAILVALLSGWGLMIADWSVASQAPQRASQRFNVSKWGTLLELFDANGKSVIKTVGDGFHLNYKTRGRKRSASVIEMQRQKLRTSSEGPKLQGNTATAIVQTADKALEITSNFTFDDNTGELIIVRTFRNISKYPVTLQGVRNYVDPRFTPGGQVKQIGAQILQPQQIRAGLAKSTYDCGNSICPVPVPPPPCPPCPNPNPIPEYSRAWLYSSPKRDILSWSKPITLEAKQNQQLGGEAFIHIRIVIK